MQGPAWLARKGASGGFEVIQTTVNAYEQRSSTQERTGHHVRFSTLDFSGILKVTDPGQMFATLTAGLGRAKAFGAGLMLVRRIH